MLFQLQNGLKNPVFLLAYLQLVRGLPVYAWRRWWACWEGGWLAPELKQRWSPSERAAAVQGRCTTSAWPGPFPDALCCLCGPVAAAPASCSGGAVPAGTQTRSLTPVERRQSRTLWPSNLMDPLEGQHPPLDPPHHLVMISFGSVLDSRGYRRVCQLCLRYYSCVGHPCVRPSDWHVESCCVCDWTGHHCSSSAGLCFSCWQQTLPPVNDHGEEFCMKMNTWLNVDIQIKQRLWHLGETYCARAVSRS